jgi:hypothetical protein
MRTIDFDLDEFKPWPALSVYVYGVATLSYEIEPGDAYSGYPRGVTYPTVESLYIASDTIDEPVQITDAHPLYKPICYILEQTDYAIDAIRRHDEQS